MVKNIKIDDELEKYIIEQSYELHPVQKEIIKHNNGLGDIKRMQISVSQGHFFQLFIKACNINTILEIGTFTGYSALSMGLCSPNAKITCLDVNQKTSEEAKKFFKKAKLDKNINIIVGPALNTLEKLKKENKVFDMIFIDADKENYVKYYNLSMNILKKKGYILIDNVLWRGDVVDATNADGLTKIIRKFNAFVKKDNRVDKTILPIGDGLTICRKI